MYRVVIAVLAMTVSMASAQLNHFQGFEVKPQTFVDIPVTLSDVFGNATGIVRRPDRIFAPADKNDTDPTAPADPDHLVGYKLTRSKTLAVNQVLQHQFGTITVDVVKPSRLLIPSSKSLVGPPAPPVTTLDHFQCYKIRRSKGTAKVPKILGVKVDDQFGTRIVDLLKPRIFCTPVDKNGSGINDPGAHQTCYKTRAPKGAFPDVFTNNQFGPLGLDLIALRELCLPTTLNGASTTTTIVTTTTTTTSTTTTTLYGSPSRAFVQAVQSLLD